jgi:hypothetical protein
MLEGAGEVWRSYILRVGHKQEARFVEFTIPGEDGEAGGQLHWRVLLYIE